MDDKIRFSRLGRDVFSFTVSYRGGSRYQTRSRRYGEDSQQTARLPRPCERAMATIISVFVSLYNVVQPIWGLSSLWTRCLISHRGPPTQFDQLWDDLPRQAPSLAAFKPPLKHTFTPWPLTQCDMLTHYLRQLKNSLFVFWCCLKEP